jgi:AP-3 complex subunit delta-1
MPTDATPQQKLLADSKLLESCMLPDSNAEVLYAAAWIAGEYCTFLSDPPETIQHILQPDATKLPPKVQAVYVHNALKIYASWARGLLYNWNEDAKSELLGITAKIKEKINLFCSCTDMEVQERVCSPHVY